MNFSLKNAPPDRHHIMKTSLSLSRGFSLIEMAMVLLIMGLLMGGGLTLLGAQIESQKIKDTQRLLEDAKEAVLGFALANGRLPCPASATSNGVESPVGGGVCTNPFNGFLPSATLGLTQTDSQGYAVDAWGLTQNRVRYAVSMANTSAFTKPNGMSTTTMALLAPDLRACASATGITATTCNTAVSLTNNAVAIIYSLGKNAPTGGSGTDEAANTNNDRVFVSHTPTAAGAAGGEFDDLVTWLSPNILFNRMVQAGTLGP